MSKKDLDFTVDIHQELLVEAGVEPVELKSLLAGLPEKSVWYWIQSIGSGEKTMLHLRIILFFRSILQTLPSFKSSPA